MKMFWLSCALVALPLCGGCVFPPPLVAGNPRVIVETNLGTFEIELFASDAPDTVANFTAYVDDGFYDGTIVHRASDGFVIEAGAFEPGLVDKPPTRAAIGNESRNGLSNRRGRVAMDFGLDPTTVTAPFFINLSDNPALDATLDARGYPVFGTVDDPDNVIGAIAAVPVEVRGGLVDVPVTDVVITRMTNLPAEQVLSPELQAYFEGVEFNLLNLGRDLLIDFIAFGLQTGLGDD